MLEVGDKAPEFTAPADGGGQVKLTDLRGQRVILYFYPKDNTPGCTKEACDFRDNMASFSEKEVAVVGVSPDSVASHDKFKMKFDLPFPLVSDPDHRIAEAYGAGRSGNGEAAVGEADGGAGVVGQVDSGVGCC